MKLFLAFTVILLLTAVSVNSQEADKKNTDYIEIFSTAFDGAQIAFHIRPEGRYANVKGSPYLDSVWRSGRIFLKADTIGSEFLVRYNVYGNEMQFLHKSDTLAISNPLMVEVILLAGHRFEYLPFLWNKNENMAWFKIIADGKARFMVRYSSRLETGTDPVSPYHCQNSADRFVSGKHYYYQLSGMAMPAEMPANKNAFLSIKKFNSQEIIDFIRSKRISFRDEEDMNVLFSWINQSLN